MLLIVTSFFVISNYFLNGFCSQITVKTSFSCQSRPTGYYADMEAGCQVYHMCDDLGRQFSYSCPNATLFQQRMLICDHWYMVNCNKSEDNYKANLLIGQRDKPFVDESEKNLYLRTPRPDFLTNTQEPEYNVMYRNGKSQSIAFSLRNVVDQVKEVTSTSTESVAYTPSQKLDTTSEGNEPKYVYNKVQDSFKKPVGENPKYSNVPKSFKDLNNYLKYKSSIDTETESSKSPDLVSERQSASGKRLDFDYSKQDEPIKKKSSSPVGVFPININEKSLKELQQLYFIPDYQFPLETVYRPSYENGKSSFQNTPNLSVQN